MMLAAHSPNFGHVQISSLLAPSTHKMHHVTCRFKVALVCASDDLAACFMRG